MNPVYRPLPQHRVVTHNPKHAWLEKSYPGFLHTLFMQGIHAGVFLMHRYFPFGLRVGYAFDERTERGSEFDWFWDARDLERIRRLFLNRSRNSLAFFNRIYRWWEVRNRAVLSLYDRSERIPVSELSDRALFRFYEKLYWENLQQGAAGYLADSFLTSGDSDWLIEFITKRIGQRKNLNAIIETLTAPTIPSFTQEEEIVLQRIAKTIHGNFRSVGSLRKYVRSRPSILRALDRHTARYFWIENNYFAKVLPPSYFVAKLYALIQRGKEKPAMQTMAQNRGRKSALLRTFGDRWLANVIDMTERMTHMQDYRKLALIRHSHFLHLIFTEMARRTGLEEEDFQNLIEPEIADVFLNRRIDRRMLRARRRKNFFYGTPRGYVIYQGQEIIRFVDETQFRRQYAGITKIKGVPACAGFVRGIARIVWNAHAAVSFKRGDILITNQTTPEFVPLMKRAAAVVTEQGGITAHAAIISRELGIPCIIGTKIATKVFRDGDRVEVDANRGVVKKLHD